MVITYYGAFFFKVQFGDLTLALNPISAQSVFKAPKFGADIALVSLRHPDLNGIEQMAYGGKEPFIISGPGEYEAKGITVKGVLSESLYGGGQAINTIYEVIIEGMRVVTLGALTSGELPAEVRNELGEIDILLVPAYGDGTLDPKDAHRLATSFEPHIIIPMRHDKNSLAIFLKEEGSEVSPIEKLTVKKKDIEGKEGEVVVLSSALS
ncbi:MAG: hypothetical protein COW88_03080 [Candidatus Lloydbacteria bacterium CG22_combo_CG10-13_8_21_14_all_47_15]|uniref:Lactamase n=1 Tax=Candidatus Lloydbacteria bacterium CG22_combo_CG10-13_8_21_14_all_47_15 TaxID=1974635 RepID=A0A2H0CTT1_9BACT|nr:MAG: hypothetical protein COW88_03080 [Candidatus Lloydbacteria bacterium CG22_combo_CG10-13_8_21_14_all_47_15]